MQLGRIIGTVVATRKDEKLAGAKLLLVQPVAPGGETVASPMLAVDAAQAGVGWFWSRHCSATVCAALWDMVLSGNPVDMAST